MVRAKRLELIRLGHQILNLARLPFRHARIIRIARKLQPVTING